MKKMTATFCLLSMSFTANAAGYNQNGRTIITGDAALTLTQLYENEGSISIGGAAAQAIWDGMTKVAISSANQFQPNDRKIGEGITCDKAVSDEIVGMKKGEVLCFISVKDRSQGKL